LLNIILLGVGIDEITVLAGIPVPVTAEPTINPSVVASFKTIVVFDIVVVALVTTDSPLRVVFGGR
jgi:hypothetical protein